LKKFLNFILNINYKGLLRLISIRPRYFFLLFKIRVIEKYIGIDPFFLSPRFLLIYFFEEKNLKNKNDYQLKELGNYFLDVDRIKKDTPLLYSGGVGANISFDKEFIKETNGYARLFDPTPSCSDFMKDKISENLKFYPYALYKDNTKTKIFYDRFNQVRSNSISNFLNFNESDFYYCDTYNIPTLIKKFNDDEIDVLKLDIEGVSIEVVENCFDNNIYPDQIIIAIEVPMNYQKFFKFYSQLKSFFKKLNKNYNLINLRNRSRGVEMEILCLKKNS